MGKAGKNGKTGQTGLQVQLEKHVVRYRRRMLAIYKLHSVDS
jgi:hypothetical protein